MLMTRLLFRLLFIVLASFLLLLASCAKQEQKPITEESFEAGLLALSSEDIKLDAGQASDFFIGLENQLQSNATFSIQIDCISGNCENNVVVQSFPTVGLAAGKKAAFPARVIALDIAAKGSYEFNVVVSSSGSEYASGKIKVEVVKSLQEVGKEELSKMVKV